VPFEEENKQSNLKPQGRYKKPLTILPDGDTYLGEWVGDKPDGVGVKNYADGNRYEGEFRNGLSHG